MEDYNDYASQGVNQVEKNCDSLNSKKRIKIIFSIILAAVFFIAAFLPKILNSSLIGIDIYDFKIKINGTVYSLPDQVKKFQENGWVFESSSYDEIYKSGEHDLVTMVLDENEDVYIEVYVYNPSEVELAISECLIYGVNVEYDYEDDDPQVIAELPKGIKVGFAKRDEVISKYGSPTKEGGDYDNLFYSKKANDNILNLKNNRAVFAFEDGILVMVSMKCI